MPTSVENVLKADDSRRQWIIVQIQAFLDNSPERLAPLRLALLGVMDLKNDDPQWTQAARDINEFLDDNLPEFEPLGN
jgi:hypothetical protein